MNNTDNYTRRWSQVIVGRPPARTAPRALHPLSSAGSSPHTSLLRELKAMETVA